MAAALKLEGTKIGDWLLIERRPKSHFFCRCVCGKEKVVSLSNMRGGVSLGCGCEGHKTTAAACRTHGATNLYTKTREYRAWADMHTRCANPNRDSAPYYIGKGITVCREWDDYRVFLADMGECPAGFSLDRLNGEMGYSKGNCRWAPLTVQNYNTVRRPGVSGERGVTLRNGKALAHIYRSGKRFYLGSFATVAEAAIARRQAEIQAYGFEAPR